MAAMSEHVGRQLTEMSQQQQNRLDHLTNTTQQELNHAHKLIKAELLANQEQFYRKHKKIYTFAATQAAGTVQEGQRSSVKTEVKQGDRSYTDSTDKGKQWFQG